MNLPENLKYTKDHEWLKIEDGVATVGITEFAQGELGDIVYVDIESVDETIDKDEVFGSVEAVKTVSDLFMPLSGEVIAFNENLEDTPEKVNSDPYGDGWLIEMELTNFDAEVPELIYGEQNIIEWFESELKKFDDKGWIAQ